MKLAVIDIGSNAVRFYIANVIAKKGEVKFKKLNYMRYPLRLGKDVFKTGKISETKYLEFRQLVNIISNTIKLYKIEHYFAVATSAMRDAENGKEVIQRLKKEEDFKIKIITGREEAKYLSKALQSTISKKVNTIHLDVGGGSTEINIYKKGVKVSSESFKIGSVRNFKDPAAMKEFEKIKSWIYNFSLKGNNAKCIGTGGNIRKLQKLSYYGTNEPIHISNLIETKEKIEVLSLKDRIEKMMLNPDRADVIVPAAEIYLAVMQWGKMDEIQVPNIGLKDGLMLDLYERKIFS